MDQEDTVVLAAVVADTPTGTMTMAEADMALVTTIPMGKPKGVAVKAAPVTSQDSHLSSSLTAFERHWLTTIRTQERLLEW